MKNNIALTLIAGVFLITMSQHAAEKNAVSKTHKQIPQAEQKQAAAGNLNISKQIEKKNSAAYQAEKKPLSIVIANSTLYRFDVTIDYLNYTNCSWYKEQQTVDPFKNVIFTYKNDELMALAGINFHYSGDPEFCPEKEYDRITFFDPTQVKSILEIDNSFRILDYSEYGKYVQGNRSRYESGKKPGKYHTGQWGVFSYGMLEKARIDDRSRKETDIARHIKLYKGLSKFNDPRWFYCPEIDDYIYRQQELNYFPSTGVCIPTGL